MKILQWYKKHQEACFIGLSVLLFVLLFSAFALPVISRPIAEKQLTKALNRDVVIGKIHINPLALSVQIDSLAIREKNSNENFVAFDRLYVNFEWISAFKRGLILKDIILENPRINVSRNSDSTYNFSDLIKSDTTKKDSSTFKYSFNNIKISGGYIQFVDLPKKSNHEIKELQLSVPFFSNFDYYTDVYCTPYFSAVVNGTPFELKGKTKPFDKSMETEIALDIDRIDLARYLEYVPEELNFNLNSAYFSADGHFTFMLKENKKPFFDYSGKLSLDKINVTDKNDSLVLDVLSLIVDVKSAEIVSSSINLNSITLTRPVLSVRRERNGDISLLSMLPQSKPDPAETRPAVPKTKSAVSKAKSAVSKAKDEPAPFKFTCAQFTLEQGKVFFTDKVFSKPFVHTADSITMSVKEVNLDQGCQYALTLVTRNVEKIRVDGNVTFKPMSANGTLSLSGIEPGAYAAYFPDNMNIELKNGTVGFQAEYAYKDDNGKSDVSISNGALNVRDLIVWQRSTREEIFRSKAFALRGLNYNLNQQRLSLDSVTTDNARIFVKRLPDGRINLAELVTPPVASENKEGTGATTSSDSGIVVKQNGAAKQAQEPFSFVVKNLKVHNYNVKFEDQATADKDSIFLERIDLTIADLSNQKNRNAKIRFSADLKSKGHLGANGTLTLEPLSSNLQLDFRNIFLKPAQAYLADKLNIALTGGDLTVLGKLDFAQMADKTINADFNGNIEIDDFATINKENADNFLLWKALKFNNVVFSLNPLKVAIKEINVKELYSLFNIYANGTTNLQAVLKTNSVSIDSLKQDSIHNASVQPDNGKKSRMSEKKKKRQTELVNAQEAAPDTQKTANTADIRIDNVILDNCNINFSDYRFRNVFSANMKNLSGKVTGLSSEQEKTADIMINGNYDATSPIVIAGKVNPLAKDLFVDIGLSFKDMDLTQMNPYSQKYLGYAIRKGTLSLDLKYFVKDKKLNSTNNIFMNQLTLGESVESTDATKLPIKFALALIRDKNGDINLNVPVTGSIDDPKFNVGKLLLQVLGNIITKAVTSPFAALGSLFGGSEELSYLEFAAGSAAINTLSLEKLDKISNGLTQREDLTVEIQGFADQTKDREGLRKYFFDHKLKAAKLKDLLKKSDENIAVDSVVVQSDEYEKYLRKVYNSESFEKPKNKIGFAKALPVPEMEKMIYDNIKVSETDLKLLANTRAMKAKEYLLNVKKIGSGRIFLIESKKISPESKTDVLDSRVEFMLKAG